MSLDIYKLRDFQGCPYSHVKTKELIQFFNDHLLTYAFEILGPPPCDYDIAALGSVAREEVCPSSNLDLMILFEPKTKASEYFQKLFKILQLQIISLGDTPKYSPFFTCLPVENRIGLHPFVSKEPLLGTPEWVANRYSSYNRHFSLMGIAKKYKGLGIRKAVVLSTTTHSRLWTTLSKKIGEINSVDFEPMRSSEFAQPKEEREAILHERRRKKYGKIYAKIDKVSHGLTSKDLKQFSKVLSRLLGDLDFYYGITKTNTLDILEEAAIENIFSEESIKWIRNAIHSIYKARVKLDLSDALTPEEEQELQKEFWLVLLPLFNTTGFYHKDQKKKNLLEHAFVIHQSSSPEEKKRLQPFLNFAVKELVLADASLEEHTKYYYLPDSEVKFYSKEWQLYYLEALDREAVHKPALVPLIQALEKMNTPVLRTRNVERLRKATVAMTTAEWKGDCIKVAVTGCGLKQTRFLSPDIVQQAIDENGDIKQFYPSSTHRLYPLEVNGYALHLRQDPFQPLMEYAIYSLMSLSDGFFTPVVDLVTFEVEKNGSKKSYPVLVTQTIQGRPLEEFIDKQRGKISPFIKNSPLESEQYTWLVLWTSLICPGNGGLSKYIVSEDGKIFSINNAMSFVKPVENEDSPHPEPKFFSVLFKLGILEPDLDVNVLLKFASLNPNFSAWIQDIKEKEKEWSANKFSSNLLREGALNTFYRQFFRLQNYITYQLKNSIMTKSQDLLSNLIIADNPKWETSAGTEVLGVYYNVYSLAYPDTPSLSSFSKKFQPGIAKYKQKLSKVPEKKLVEFGGGIPSHDQMKGILVIRGKKGIQ